MAEAIYVLCGLTSLAITVLSWRGYRRSGARLLFWNAACFALLTANNVVLFLDLSVFTEVDLSLLRSVAALCGVCVLLFGLVWESR